MFNNYVHIASYIREAHIKTILWQMSNQAHYIYTWVVKKFNG